MGRDALADRPDAEPGRDTFSQLWGVACTSATACIAVGDTARTFGSHQVPLAEIWDGAVWKVQPIPAPHSHSDLRGIACASAVACVAVGGYRNDRAAFSETWDGTAWTIRPVPVLKGTRSSYLIDVSCSGPSACTAVGNAQRVAYQTITFAERWDGTTWTAQPTPNEGILGSYLYGVACPGATTCIAVGAYLGNSRLCQPPNHCDLTLAEAWDGNAWTILPTPKPPRHAFAEHLSDLECTSLTSCTAVGGRDDQRWGLQLPVSETWDGVRWRRQPMPPKGKDQQFIFLYTLSCTGANACVAVGGRDNLTLAERE